MLQALGVVLIFATVGAVVMTFATSLFEERGARVAAGALAGAWVGFLIDVVLSGGLKYALMLPALFLVPFLVAAIVVVVSPTARERLLDIPRRIILGVNILRAIGFLFVSLAFAGQLAGPFPYFAGIGDIVTGFAAIPLALGEPQLARNDLRLILWNIVGLLDLVAAVALGVTSINGSPLQIIHAGVGSNTILQLPWALVPLFLVPCYMIGHLVVFAQMRASTERAKYAMA